MDESREVLKYLDQVCNPSKLERDRNLEQLMKIDITLNDYETIMLWIDIKFKADSIFENCLGSLLVCKLVLIKCKFLTPEFLKSISEQCLKSHLHNDCRIRILAGECMGLLCQISGVEQFRAYIPIIISGIEVNLIKNENSTKNVSDEATGCKSLESWLMCFKAIINGIGEKFGEIVNMKMLSVIFEIINHKDRYIREACYDLLGTVAEKHGCENDKEIFVNVCQVLRKGLSDNWSQVRMSASIATRKILLVNKPTEVEEAQAHSILLPGICLNRHYLADGVKLYNQETWKIVVGEQGQALLQKHISETVLFFIDQSSADNHVVREAACASISEIAMKLNRDIVRPFVPRLLEAVNANLNNTCWSVREIASLAFGRLVESFPVEAKSCIPDVFSLFFLQIQDSVPSVRESGAFSLANVIGACDQVDNNLLKEAFNYIMETLEIMKDQNTEICSKDKSQILYKYESKEDPDINSKPSKVNELNEGSFREHWEKADGSLLLMGELVVNVKESHIYIDKFVSSLVKVCNNYQHPHHFSLLGTACKVISDFCEGLGKQILKRYLSDLLPIIELSLTSECKYTVTKVEATVRLLSLKIGPNILRGRIEMYSNDLLLKINYLL